MARCTGSSGGFASYLRDPLLGTYRETGLVIMSAQSSAHAGWTRTLVAEPQMPACDNFLYCIKIALLLDVVARFDCPSQDSVAVHLALPVRVRRLEPVLMLEGLLQHERHRSENLEKVVDGQTEVVDARITFQSAMP
jgi:hypothetical protein